LSDKQITLINQLFVVFLLLLTPSALIIFSSFLSLQKMASTTTSSSISTKKEKKAKADEISEQEVPKSSFFQETLAETGKRSSNEFLFQKKRRVFDEG
jgi:hypothetical protein